MALIRRFERIDMERNSLHKEIPAKFAIFKRDGRSFVQINMHGSEERLMPDKTSQTIQLDREGADALRAILDEAFPR
jgi:hypothetical protein